MARPFQASSNGDRWLLVCDPTDGRSLIRHEANPASGGYVTEIGLSAFLAADHGGPEHRALWLLIATLTDDGSIPAFAVV